MKPLFARSNKGSVDGLGKMAIGMGVFVIIVVIMTIVLAGVRDTTTTNTTERNIAVSGVAAMGTFGDWFDILVIVAIAGAILALIAGAFLYFDR
ncbi:hypothetical protein KY333_03745 [Candidatus Woesearchaeota archaeon]|nr:hypothetical protein [Candidatus Woesearchaeota archaeon]